MNMKISDKVRSAEPEPKLMVGHVYKCYENDIHGERTEYICISTDNGHLVDLSRGITYLPDDINPEFEIECTLELA